MDYTNFLLYWHDFVRCMFRLGDQCPPGHSRQHAYGYKKFLTKWWHRFCNAYSTAQRNRFVDRIINFNAVFIICRVGHVLRKSVNPKRIRISRRPQNGKREECICIGSCPRMRISRNHIFRGENILRHRKYIFPDVNAVEWYQKVCQLRIVKVSRKPEKLFLEKYTCK
jgi:hypothetical protein